MRTAATVAVALLVVLAGCGATGGGDGGGADPTDTTDVPPPGANESNTVAYEALNDRQQAAFRAAIDDEARFVPNTSYVDESEGYRYDQIGPFEEHDFVRYQGEFYRLEFAHGRLYAQYGIDASHGDPGPNDTVVALEDLPADLRDEVRTAITDGHYTVPAGKWRSLPEPLGNADYVRFENETYDLDYAHGDIWAPVMSVEQVG